MAINNVISNISLSNQLQLTNGSLDTRVASNAGLDATGSGLQINANYLQSKVVHVTSAQFKDLAANPVIMTSGAGLDYVVAVTGLEIECNFNTTPYSNGSNLSLMYGRLAYSADDLATQEVDPAVITNINADTIVNVLAPTTPLVFAPFNQPIYIRVSGADFTAGDSDFYFRIWYVTYQYGN